MSGSNTTWCAAVTSVAALFAAAVPSASAQQTHAMPPAAERLDARSIRQKLQPSAGEDCESTALVILAANQHEAITDFWLTIGAALNEPAGDWADLLKEAFATYTDALALADAQYQERLDACGGLGSGKYDPDLDPGDFSSDIDNDYFPLVPETTFVYERHSGGDFEQVEVTVQKRTIDLNGIEVRAVHDVGSLNGEVTEDTTDWYAQDDDDNVWYIGELSMSIEDGFLDNLDGSWRYGKDGAKPGIVMLGDPQVGDFYRQEFLVNEAEDLAKVLSLDETVTVPYGTFDHCLQTLEWSPMEPGVHEWKYYAPGVGLVLELDVETGERLELVKVRHH